MGRVELKHYPASKLPDDLRGEIGVDAMVTIVIEEDAHKPKPMTGEELKAMLSQVRTGESTSINEAVTRIRILRDEWDD